MARKHERLRFFKMRLLHWPPTIEQVKDAYDLDNDVAAAEKLLWLGTEVPNATRRFLINRFFNPIRPDVAATEGGSECGAATGCHESGELEFMICENGEECMAELYHCPDGHQWVCPEPSGEALPAHQPQRARPAYRGPERRINGPRRGADRVLSSQRGDGDTF